MSKTNNDGMPDFREMVENIMTLWQNSTDVEVFEGTHWYDSAREFASDLAIRYATNVKVVACIIAAHSMNASWKVNMQRTVSQLQGSPVGLSASITMANNAIANNANGLDPFDAVIGPKVNPFARCVAGDLTAVATDRWAQRAAFDTLDDKTCNRWISRNGVRDTMIAAYKRAAEIAGVEPAVMQAIVWVVVRGYAD
jgi:hypothetical protein